MSRSDPRIRPPARPRAGGAALALAALLVLPACAGERSRDLVLITVDTLRADHLGVYGYGRDTSPTLDALAGRGVRFEDASVQWPSTWPSMASMLTGTYPNETGVRHKPYVALSDDNVTLAERLSAQGYQTAAIVANANLGVQMGFEQGFEVFVESWMEEFRRQTGEERYVNRPGLVKRYTDAARVTEQALAWLAGRDRERPFFLWVHYMDPHGPYQPPERYQALFDEPVPERIVSFRQIPRYQRQREPGTGLPIRDLSYYVRRYDQEIRYLDDELKRLLAALDALPRPPVLALTADHGESLTEHDYFLEHGAAPFQPGARVPLLLVDEARIPPATVVESPVALVQLLPTLLELLGMTPPEPLAARSLLPALAGPVPPRDLYLEAGVRERPQRIVRRGRWKLVHIPDRRDRLFLGQPEYALFDLASDPGESTNRYFEQEEIATELRESLEGWLASLGEFRSGEAPELSPEEWGMLRDLGYVFEEEEPAPDPQEAGGYDEDPE